MWIANLQNGVSITTLKQKIEKLPFPQLATLRIACWGCLCQLIDPELNYLENLNAVNSKQDWISYKVRPHLR